MWLEAVWHRGEILLAHAVDFTPLLTPATTHRALQRPHAKQNANALDASRSPRPRGLTSSQSSVVQWVQGLRLHASVLLGLRVALQPWGSGQNTSRSLAPSPQLPEH
ncbi:hypothetical protein EYF80_040538 [Liparis tanakae]|uniref:Uncharacterized protein n=1 Tax=Liparis tanakae TaxID=230148 RepID=A0A4Z2G7Y7_9TELE|nr:hypothetical protein EYF80_040538 [Liparis tanakae]